MAPAFFSLTPAFPPGFSRLKPPVLEAIIAAVNGICDGHHFSEWNKIGGASAYMIFTFGQRMWRCDNRSRPISYIWKLQYTSTLSAVGEQAACISKYAVSHIGLFYWILWWSYEQHEMIGNEIIMTKFSLCGKSCHVKSLPKSHFLMTWTWLETRMQWSQHWYC